MNSQRAIAIYRPISIVSIFQKQTDAGNQHRCRLQLLVKIAFIEFVCSTYSHAGFVLHQKGAEPARYFSRCVGRNEQKLSADPHAVTPSAPGKSSQKSYVVNGKCIWVYKYGNISLIAAVLLTIYVRRALIMFTGMHIQFISLEVTFLFRSRNARWGRCVRHRGGLFLPGGGF
jgi:hypothetical protein